MFVQQTIAHGVRKDVSSHILLLCRLGETFWLAQTTWISNYLPARFISSTPGYETVGSGEMIHNYIKEKELSTFHFIDIPGSREDLHTGLCTSLAALSHDLKMNFDSLDPKPSNNSAVVQEFILSSPRYPKASFFPDGHVNVSLAKRGHYRDFIREARHFRAEEIASSVRLYPARRSRGRIKETKVQQLQRNLDIHLPNLIAGLNTSDLARVLRHMYLLDISIRADNLSDISKRILKGLNSMSFSELVEIAFLLRSYMSDTIESCHLVICAIGNCLERRCESLMRLPVDEALKQLTPLVQIQIHYPCTAWTVLNNTSLLQYLITNVDKLGTDGKADLFTVLTLSNSTVPLLDDFSKARGDVASQLNEIVCDISDRSLERLLTISGLFESDFPQLSNSLYYNSLTRSKSMRPTLLASIYLKLNMKNDVIKQFQYDIGRRFVEIATNVLVDLYCHFIQDGMRSTRQLHLFEHAFSKKPSTLSMRHMSTILMYQGMHGTAPSRLNDIIRSRFAELKQTGCVKHDELMDVVLSMSLVGLHNGVSVWKGVDLPHLVYSTPHNILVYLGYTFLMTRERNKDIWTILLERIIYESKTQTAEVYEVLKAAKAFGILGDDMNKHMLRRASWILQHTKSQHYAKVSRQRYQSPAPIEEALDLIGLPSSKGVMIEELYEAPFFIRSHKIILDPLRESYLHPTTGLEVGEAHLRHSVWRKQGYHPFPLNDKALRKFRDVESGDWNIPELADFICNVVKMQKYSPLKGHDPLAILRTKKHKKRSIMPIKKQFLMLGSSENNIHRLQKILLDRTRRM